MTTVLIATILFHALTLLPKVNGFDLHLRPLLSSHRQAGRKLVEMSASVGFIGLGIMVSRSVVVPCMSNGRAEL